MLKIQYKLIQREAFFFSLSLIQQYCCKGSNLNFIRTVYLRTGTHMSDDLNCGCFDQDTGKAEYISVWGDVLWKLHVDYF